MKRIPLLLLTAMAGPATVSVALAGVTVSPAEPPTLAPGGTCTFTAMADDDSEPLWEWAVEAGGGSILAEGGKCVYTAPASVVGTRTFTLTVLDGARRGQVPPRQVQVRVANPASAAGHLEADGKAGQVFRLSLLAGRPDGRFPSSAERVESFDSIRGMVWVPRRGAPKQLAGKLLVANQGKILAVDPDGRAETWVETPTARAGQAGPAYLAIRPGSGEAGSPWQCLFSDEAGHYIGSVDDQGRISVLAGIPGTRGCKDGPATEAKFHAPRAVAVDRDGTVYVIDSGNWSIRKIAKGVVSTLAGKVHFPRAGASGPTPPSFLRASGLALEPETGDLYVCRQDCTISRVDSKGQVTLMAGKPGASGFEAWRDGAALPEGPARLAGTPCLSDPGTCQFVGHHLVFVDTDNNAVRAWDRTTGALSTRAATPFDPDRDWRDEASFRAGRAGNGRNLAPGETGKMKWPKHAAFDDRGHLYVALKDCILKLVPEPAAEAKDGEPASTRD